VCGDHYHASSRAAHLFKQQANKRDVEINTGVDMHHEEHSATTCEVGRVFDERHDAMARCFCKDTGPVRLREKCQRIDILPLEWPPGNAVKAEISTISTT
jgi:hypothetical protein